MREIQKEAKNVQAAIDAALKELGLRRDQVEVMIKSEGSSGFLGIGAQPAKVVVRERKWRSDNVEESAYADARETRHEARSHSRHGGSREDRPQRRKERGGRRSGGRHERQERHGERRERTEYEPQNLELEPYIASCVNQNHPIPQEHEQACEAAKTALLEILPKLGVKGKITSSGWDPIQTRILVEFECDCPDVLTGKNGSTLEAMQYLITLMVSRKRNSPLAVRIDTANYWKNIEERIIAGINRAVISVKRTGRDYRLESMPSSQRRFVHKILAEHPEVETASEGEGKWRKVVIRPKQAQPVKN